MDTGGWYRDKVAQNGRTAGRHFAVHGPIIMLSTVAYCNYSLILIHCY